MKNVRCSFLLSALSVAGLYLVRAYERMCIVGQRRGKQVNIAAVFQLEPFAQFAHIGREIAYGKVRFVKAAC